MALLPGLQHFKRGKPIPADGLNAMADAISAVVVGAGGNNVRRVGNKLVIEYTGRPAHPFGPVASRLRTAFKNGSGEDIPADSLAVITEVDANGLVVVGKPDADNIEAARLIITGPAIVPDDTVGQGWAANLGLGYVTYSGTEPTAGDDFGSVSGQWYGATDNTGFKANGTNGGRALVGPFTEPAAGVEYYFYPITTSTLGSYLDNVAAPYTMDWGPHAVPAPAEWFESAGFFSANQGYAFVMRAAAGRLKNFKSSGTFMDLQLSLILDNGLGTTHTVPINYMYVQGIPNATPISGAWKLGTSGGGVPPSYCGLSAVWYPTADFVLDNFTLRLAATGVTHAGSGKIEMRIVATSLIALKFDYVNW